MKELSFTVKYGSKDITAYVIAYFLLSEIPNVYRGVSYLIHDFYWIIDKVRLIWT